MALLQTSIKLSLNKKSKSEFGIAILMIKMNRFL
jgi:hypothetical protein